MPQYLVTAYDGTDAEAPARRQAVRDAHIAGVTAMAAKGEIIVGGALGDEAGAMIGSVAVVEFASRADLDAWLAREPYVTGGVWQTVAVTPMRVAVRAP
ncbi:YciI family protein [Lichenibacterium dinghuense]|uniref:YciI family protein n=1 Tax=Lichenibacterium dinghuense TaxID=2895977 RepID=UPI001F1E8891|nr:YciI family protein [Lichenibacterium sp. 6Y81]